MHSSVTSTLLLLTLVVMRFTVMYTNYTVRALSSSCFPHLQIDLNRLRRHRALEFRQPVTQGKHSVKRSLYKALHKRLSLVLRTWRPARTISYRPFLKHQRFAVWSLLINDYELFYGFGDWTLKSFKNWELFSKFNFKS